MASTASSKVTEEASTSSAATIAFAKKRVMPRERASIRRVKEKEREREVNGTKKREVSVQSDDSPIFKFAKFILRLIAYQVNALTQVVSLMNWIMNSCFAVASQPVQTSMQARNKAAQVMSEKLALISQVWPRVAETGGNLLRKMGFGCLAATYALSIFAIFLFVSVPMGLFFVNVLVDKPVIMKHPLYFDYTQSNPVATVFLASSKAVQGHSGWRVIPAGHRFRAGVTFVLPDSDYNRRIGMFQVTAELIHGKNETLAKFSQPCMLRYYSAPVRLARAFALGIPLLMGLFVESQTLEIDLIDYVEGYVPTQMIKMLLQPKAGSSELPELYSSEIDIRSQLPWTRDFIRSWKWTFSVWSCLVFFLMLVGLVLVCCRKLFLPTSIFASAVDKSRRSKEGPLRAVAEPSTSMPTKRQRYGVHKRVSVSRDPSGSQQKETVMPARHDDKGKLEMSVESARIQATRKVQGEPAEKSEESEVTEALVSKPGGETDFQEIEASSHGKSCGESDFQRTEASSHGMTPKVQGEPAEKSEESEVTEALVSKPGGETDFQEIEASSHGKSCGETDFRRTEAPSHGEPRGETDFHKTELSGESATNAQDPVTVLESQEEQSLQSVG